MTSDPLKEDNCVRGYTLSLVLAIQLEHHLAGLLPKGDTLLSGSGSRRPGVTLLCCKPRQSKSHLSNHFVQSRNCDNLLSSLYICIVGIPPSGSLFVPAGTLSVVKLLTLAMQVAPSGVCFFAYSRQPFIKQQYCGEPFLSTVTWCWFWGMLSPKN